jgi:hypothetical protein
MAALYVGGQFKGRCNKCGKCGHKGVACHSKAGDDKAKMASKPTGFTSRKFSGECHYCKKTGHKRSECFKKKKDQGEDANIAKGNDKAEVILMILDLKDFTNECDNDSSESDDNFPDFIERVVYEDSSDDDSIPPLMKRFCFDSSLDDESKGDDDQAFVVMGDKDNSKNQIGHCSRCGGNGHTGMYCDN